MEDEKQSKVRVRKKILICERTSKFLVKEKENKLLFLSHEKLKFARKEAKKCK